MTQQMEALGGEAQTFGIQSEAPQPVALTC